VSSRSRGSLGDRIWLGPVLGLGVLAALVAVYVALTRPPAHPKPAPSLLGITADQIAALEFHSHGQALTLYANNGKDGKVTWTIGAPGGTPADQNLVQGFVSDLVTLNASRKLLAAPGPSDLQQFGLQPPQASLVVHRKGGAASVELDVGLTAPTGEYYARVGGDPAVYLIAGMVPSEISADPKAWLPVPSATGSGSSSSTSAAAGSGSASGGAGG
jgi:hypothetical protein